jgi:hypothetical protein
MRRRLLDDMLAAHTDEAIPAKRIGRVLATRLIAAQA